MALKPERMTFGQWIRARRQERGWSQEQLGFVIGELRAGQASISRMERTTIGIPAPDELEQRCSIFGVPVQDPLIAMGYLSGYEVSDDWPVTLRGFINNAPLAPGERDTLLGVVGIIERLQAAEGR